VTSAVSVAGAVTATRNHYGHCDVLVNNAGILPKRLLEDETTETWDLTMAVNLRGPFLCTRHFGALMRESGGGSIVNIGSIGATAPTLGAGAYSASKAGLLALTRQTAVEWGQYGIRANAVSPGYMHTPMTQSRYAVPGLAEQRASKIPLGRIAELTEVASVVTFLASAASSYVNGQELLVDGGFSHTATRQMAQPSANDSK
ncbi:MAG: SDR family oxidoreductase, partial [Acidimicrobiales bacterium]